MPPRYTLSAPCSHAVARYTASFVPWGTVDVATPRPPDLTPVLPHAPWQVRRCVEQLARYFRREFDYDFVQYTATESHYDDQVRRVATWPFLWCDREPFVDVDRRGTLVTKAWVIGACCFRWREWQDAPAGWALQWMWLHPYRRGTGVLTRAWPYFLACFGEFLVEPPLSPAMTAFLRRHGRLAQWPYHDSTRAWP